MAKTIRELFSEMTAQYKELLPADEYEKLLDTGDDFARKVVPLNHLANAMSLGWGFRFWYMFDKLFWEADNTILDMHIDCPQEGHTDAGEAMIAMINAIAARHNERIAGATASKIN